MLTQLIHELPNTLAAVFADPTFNSKGITSWLAKHIVPLIIVFLGILILSKAAKGDVGSTLTVVLLAIIGVSFFGGAGLFYAFGDNMADLIFGG